MELGLHRKAQAEAVLVDGQAAGVAVQEQAHRVAGVELLTAHLMPLGEFTVVTQLPTAEDHAGEPGAGVRVRLDVDGRVGADDSCAGKWW